VKPEPGLSRTQRKGTGGRRAEKIGGFIEKEKGQESEGGAWAYENGRDHLGGKKKETRPDSPVTQVGKEKKKLSRSQIEGGLREEKKKKRLVKPGAKVGRRKKPMPKTRLRHHRGGPQPIGSKNIYGGQYVKFPPKNVKKNIIGSLTNANKRISDQRPGGGEKGALECDDFSRRAKESEKKGGNAR